MLCLIAVWRSPSGDDWQGGGRSRLTSAESARRGNFKNLAREYPKPLAVAGPAGFCGAVCARRGSVSGSQGARPRTGRPSSPGVKHTVEGGHDQPRVARAKAGPLKPAVKCYEIAVLTAAN